MQQSPLEPGSPSLNGDITNSKPSHAKEPERPLSPQPYDIAMKPKINLKKLPENLKEFREDVIEQVDNLLER